MATDALVLFEPSEAALASRVEAALGFFGIGCRLLASDAIADHVGELGENGSLRVIAPAVAALKLFDLLERQPDASRSNIHSIFVFASGDTSSLEALATRCTGSAAATVATPRSEVWAVSDLAPEFCGAMGGLRVAAVAGDCALSLRPVAPPGQEIVYTSAGAALMRIDYGSIPVVLSSGGLIDIRAPLVGRNFDIRAHFLEAAPIVFYIRWAFAAVRWQVTETPACLVIDDPLLTPRYGFLDFERLHALMRQLDFSTNIAFIPWNWKRSSGTTVERFRQDPERLSLSVHGCDHSGAEFGSTDSKRLALKAKLAFQRMVQHRTRTGIPFDPVMVFPQGVFSSRAMEVLKRSGFIGVVNTEVLSVDFPPRPVTVADYWNVATTNYADFPIFTRRYPSQGVENFAFDAMLGKPSIVVSHHSDCDDDCSHVGAFIAKLKALNWPLKWTNLTEVVRRGFRQRLLDESIVEIEMFASQARVENGSGASRRYHIRKRESAPGMLAAVQVDALSAEWRVSGTDVLCDVEIEAGESRLITFVYHPHVVDASARENLKYRAKTLLRRLLSEMRDNYAMPLRRLITSQSQR